MGICSSIYGDMWGGLNRGRGLGFMIYDASEYMTMEIIYGGILMISLLGLLIERVGIGQLEKHTIQKWGVNVER